MRIALIGATGLISRSIITEIIMRKILDENSHLQLVEIDDPKVRSVANGLRNDILDAWDSHIPQIELVFNPSQIDADVIIMCAGATTTADSLNSGVDARAQIANQNNQLFNLYADAIKEHGNGHEIVIVVSNPVELGVKVFAEKLGAFRVLSMGAWNDTLRFRKEIAAELKISRREVSGWVCGQHGNAFVPLWSTVKIAKVLADERKEIVKKLQGERNMANFTQEYNEKSAKLAEMIKAGQFEEGYRFVNSLTADFRSGLIPHLTQFSGNRTPLGTASATVDIVETLFDGREIAIAGQVKHADDAEIAGKKLGVFGSPIIVGPNGWSRYIINDELREDEIELIHSSIDSINSVLSKF